MNDNFSLSLETYAILLLALVPVVLSFLFLNKKANVYLKEHFIIDAIVGSALVLSIWLIGNHFIDWKLSAVIALVLTYIVENIRKFKKTVDYFY